jgi:hypothetical protein
MRLRLGALSTSAAVGRMTEADLCAVALAEAAAVLIISTDRVPAFRARTAVLTMLRRAAFLAEERLIGELADERLGAASAMAGTEIVAGSGDLADVRDLADVSPVAGIAVAATPAAASSATSVASLLPLAPLLPPCNPICLRCDPLNCRLQ